MAQVQLKVASYFSSFIKKGSRRVTSVASGFPTKNLRSRESAKMLNWAIRTFDTVQVALTDAPIDQLEVWMGKKNKVDVSISEDIYLTVPKRKKNTIKAVIEYNGPVLAPITKGDKLGILNVYVNGELEKTADIFSNENIKKANIFSRLLRSFNFLVWGDV